MNDEWLIYQSHTFNSLGLYPYEARLYDRWAEHVSEVERQRSPVIARGLTKTQARQLIELSKEPK